MNSESSFDVPSHGLPLPLDRHPAEIPSARKPYQQEQAVRPSVLPERQPGVSSRRCPFRGLPWVCFVLWCIGCTLQHPIDTSAPRPVRLWYDSHAAMYAVTCYSRVGSTCRHVVVACGATSPGSAPVRRKLAGSRSSNATVVRTCPGLRSCGMWHF